MSNDEDHVKMIMDSEQGQKHAQGSGPALSSYTLEAERLDQVIELLQVQIATTAAAAGAKKLPKVNPQPRPGTAFERVQHQRRVAGAQSVAARFLRRKQEDQPVDSGQ